MNFGIYPLERSVCRPPPNGRDIGVAAEVADAWFAQGAERAGWLADVAVQSLVDEAELTPKPALVDRRGCGAHRDLDLTIMRRSAHSLRPGFLAMAQAADADAPDSLLRETLGRLGREAEQAMLAVTHGSNTHRGAIWVIGLLVAATMRAPENSADAIAAAAARIARHPDRFAPVSLSNGRRVCHRYGVRGARGEAEDGFPHVVAIALPALRDARRRGRSEEVARLDALLSVMSSLDDTCLLHRGGTEALTVAKQGASEIMAAGGCGSDAGRRRLAALDSALLVRNASPGGAADLLAAALFLDCIERDAERPRPAQPRSR